MSIYCSKWEKRSTSLFTFSATFYSPCFFASNFIQVLLFTALLEGVRAYHSLSSRRNWAGDEHGCLVGKKSNRQDWGYKNCW